MGNGRKREQREPPTGVMSAGVLSSGRAVERHEDVVSSDIRLGISPFIFSPTEIIQLQNGPRLASFPELVL